jgi:hypothetical protein
MPVVGTSGDPPFCKYDAVSVVQVQVSAGRNMNRAK